MNILFSNINRNYIINYDLNIMKEIQGLYTSKEIVSMLTDVTYNKLIIDITSIKDYGNLDNVRELSSNLDSSKIVLILTNEPMTLSTYYISNLVNMGIYNFTVIPGEIPTLLVNPRNFEQAKQIDYSNINN